MSETFASRTWNADQSWHREDVIRAGDRKLRIHVRRNAFDAQSHGLVEVWTATGWSQVARWPGVELEVCRGRSLDGSFAPRGQKTSDERNVVSYVQHELTPDGLDAFDRDVQRLLNEAIFVLDIDEALA